MITGLRLKIGNESIIPSSAKVRAVSTLNVFLPRHRVCGHQYLLLSKRPRRTWIDFHYVLGFHLCHSANPLGCMFVCVASSRRANDYEVFVRLSWQVIRSLHDAQSDGLQ